VTRVVGFYTKRQKVRPVTAKTARRSKRSKVVVKKRNPRGERGPPRVGREAWPRFRRGVSGWRWTSRGWRELKTRGGSRRTTYETPMRSAPKLHPAKLAQRKALANGLRRRGTVLELYAGKGNLTRGVYASKADRLIMVDQDPKALEKAYRRLGGHRHKAELHAMDNEDYLDQVKPGDLKDLAVVDFDPFGSPGKAVQKFFSIYKVEKPLLVAITDGASMKQGYLKGDESKRWMRRHYGVSRKSDGSRHDTLATVDSMMESLGRRHGFRVERVSVAHGDQRAIYLGYRVSPGRGRRT
jgi:16S rRNA G966 N2-methylase RsmD